MSTHTETSSCPFCKDDQLNGDLNASLDYLPGHPRIKISDQKGLFHFMHQEWMSKRDSSNISPLHQQRVKGRQLIVTEDPRLHLVWIDDRVFLKPLTYDPFRYGAAAKLRKAALGYLRTYSYLIPHESDLRIAQDSALCLVPTEVTWLQFCQFTARFNDITDNEVSGRYHYGEIRFHYQHVTYQYRAYFARIQGPLISTFPFFSTLLNCMQVNLAASTSDERYSSALLFAGCYWLSTFGSVTGVLMLMLEWRFAIAQRLLWGKNSQQIPEGHV
ncbi:hypothetical protein BDV12DRAFT_180568 [Aspergillus spectabilis]